MRRLLIVAALLFLTSPAWAVETWYLRTTAGNACGPGDDETISETQGSSDTSKTLDGTGDNFDVVEIRTIAAGNWQVCTDVDNVGGGSPPSTRWLVEHMNSSCSVQTTIIDETAVTSSDGEFCSATADPGQIAFSAGDLIVVTIFKSAGARQLDLDYNGSGTSFDSRLTHPDEFVASTRSRVVDIQGK